MKRLAWVLVLAAAGPGCVTMTEPDVAHLPPQPEPAEVEEAPPPRPITADQITEEKSDEQLQQLQDEVERELHAPPRR